MKSLFVFLCAFVLSALAHAESVTIAGGQYDLKVDCDPPYTAHVQSAQCGSEETIYVAIASKLDLKASVKERMKIPACFNTVMSILTSVTGKKICKKAKNLSFKVYDNSGKMFFEALHTGQK